MSDAVAETLIVADTVAPAAGLVIETVGGVVSLVAVALAWFDGALTFPAASRAMTT